MSKTEQALLLDPPSELHFKGPFNVTTTTHLKLTNPTDRQIAFKVKTTAPKTYCVRPNGGIIQPKKSVTVAVMLQPFDTENDDRSKDKFMVQSMYVPEGDVNHDTMWHDTPNDGLMNSKLKCVFGTPPDAAAASATTQVIADVVDKPKPEIKNVAVPEIKASNVDSETKKLREEFKKLKAELNDLRQENSTLKEEGLRSRVAYDTRTRGTSAKPPDSDSRHPPANKLGFSNYLLVISIFIFVLGFYIGKFVL